MSKLDSSKRKFIKTAAYIAPAVLTLKAAPSFATGGSGMTYKKETYSETFSKTFSEKKKAPARKKASKKAPAKKKKVAAKAPAKKKKAAAKKKKKSGSK